MNVPVLRAENLTIQFGGVIAAHEISLDIFENEFVAIIGPNGSGKTTFLNLCTGYVQPVAGEVDLDGRRITRLAPRSITRHGIARAFQIPQLFTDRTISENLMLAIAARESIWQAMSPLNRAIYRDEARFLLGLAKLDSIAEKHVSELPEGIRKLTDILMALALKPRLILLDEPTSGVSTDERFELMEVLMTALREEKTTVLFVEHDMEIVRRYADRVAVWDSGKIVKQGDPHSVLRDPRVLESVVGVA